MGSEAGPQERKREVEKGRRHHEVGESCKHGHKGEPIRARVAQAEHGRLELGVIDREVGKRAIEG